MLPNNDLLVAETNAPPKCEYSKGIMGWVMKWVMRRDGAGVPSANRISLLRDANGDGIAETRSVFLSGLHSPFGMVLVGNSLHKEVDRVAIWEVNLATGASRNFASGLRNPNGLTLQL